MSGNSSPQAQPNTNSSSSSSSSSDANISESQKRPQDSTNESNESSKRQKTSANDVAGNSSSSSSSSNNISESRKRPRDNTNESSGRQNTSANDVAGNLSSSSLSDIWLRQDRENNAKVERDNAVEAHVNQVGQQRKDRLISRPSGNLVNELRAGRLGNTWPLKDLIDSSFYKLEAYNSQLARSVVTVSQFERFLGTPLKKGVEATGIQILPAHLRSDPLERLALRIHRMDDGNGPENVPHADLTRRLLAEINQIPMGSRTSRLLKIENVAQYSITSTNDAPLDESQMNPVDTVLRGANPVHAAVFFDVDVDILNQEVAQRRASLNANSN
jgi:hypothetical protein